MARAKKAMRNFLRAIMAVIITLTIYGLLLIAVYYLFKLRETVGAAPMTLIGLGGMFGILAGHVRQNLVQGNTFCATAKLTLRDAMHDRQVFPLIMRAVEWFGLSLAATGVAAVIDKL